MSWPTSPRRVRPPTAAILHPHSSRAPPVSRVPRPPTERVPSHNAPIGDSVTQVVTIIDPQHPLCGQQFPLAQTTASCPATVVTIILPGGDRRRVPRTAVTCADLPSAP